MRKYILFFILFLILGCNNQPSVKLDFKSIYKPKENPIIKADSDLTFVCPIKNETLKWQQADVFNPAAIVKDDKVYLLYQCIDNPVAFSGKQTSRIGLAYSADGLHFEKYPTPVLFPDTSNFKQYDYPGGCEDPRIVETEDGLYVLTYSSWNNKLKRISIAFSNDLIHWEKKGLAFAKANNGRFLNKWSKSGSIVTKSIIGKQVVAKIHGKYWMYWGEVFLKLAWSDNLIDWNPVLKENGDIKNILGPRKNKFDSFLLESGPPALITEEGIVLFYNGRNSDREDSDTSLPKLTYSIGKVVFDINDMEKVVYRSDKCLLKPTLPHEILGQYRYGGINAEGLVHFHSNWYLYYGAADSSVGVAILE